MRADNTCFAEPFALAFRTAAAPAPCGKDLLDQAPRALDRRRRGIDAAVLSPMNASPPAGHAWRLACFVRGEGA